MAEITLDGIKYTTIDDNTVKASKQNSSKHGIISPKVKIKGQEYLVTEIGELMLYKNKSIPDSVTSIRRICSSTLIIPTSVKTINNVSGENGILMLSIKRVTPPNIDKAIYLAKDDVLIVPKGAARAYNNHSLWGKFKNISEDPSLQESASIRSSNNGDDDFNSGEDRNKSGVSKRKRDELQKKIAEIQGKREEFLRKR